LGWSDDRLQVETSSSTPNVPSPRCELDFQDTDPSVPFFLSDLSELCG